MLVSARPLLWSTLTLPILIFVISYPIAFTQDYKVGSNGGPVCSRPLRFVLNFLSDSIDYEPASSIGIFGVGVTAILATFVGIVRYEYIKSRIRRIELKRWSQQPSTASNQTHTAAPSSTTTMAAAALVPLVPLVSLPLGSNEHISVVPIAVGASVGPVAVSPANGGSRLVQVTQSEHIEPVTIITQTLTVDAANTNVNASTITPSTLVPVPSSTTTTSAIVLPISALDFNLSGLFQSSNLLRLLARLNEFGMVCGVCGILGVIGVAAVQYHISIYVHLFFAATFFGGIFVYECVHTFIQWKIETRASEDDDGDEDDDDEDGGVDHRIVHKTNRRKNYIVQFIINILTLLCLLPTCILMLIVPTDFQYVPNAVAHTRDRAMYEAAAGFEIGTFLLMLLYLNTWSETFQKIQFRMEISQIKQKETINTTTNRTTTTDTSTNNGTPGTIPTAAATAPRSTNDS